MHAVNLRETLQWQEEQKYQVVRFTISFTLPVSGYDLTIISPRLFNSPFYTTAMRVFI
jgi:hypothetical protein